MIDIFFLNHATFINILSIVIDCNLIFPDAGIIPSSGEKFHIPTPWRVHKKRTITGFFVNLFMI